MKCCYRRITFKLAMFLVLGAIINIAVAWGLARWQPSWMNSSFVLPIGSQDSQAKADIENYLASQRTESENSPLSRFGYNSQSGIGWLRDHEYALDNTITHAANVSIRHLWTGWPTRTLEGSYYRISNA